MKRIYLAKGNSFRIRQEDDFRKGFIFHNYLKRGRKLPTVIGTAVILAGGLGTRLRPLTETIPKPLLLLRGKPILLHIIENAKRYGVRTFLLSIGYRAQQVVDYFGDGSSLGVQIQYAVEKEPLGTGGSIKGAAAKFKEPFFLLWGDNLTDINLREMHQAYQEHQEGVTMALTPREDVEHFGVAALEAEVATRVVLLRSGVVLGKGDGGLSPLFTLFKLGKNLCGTERHACGIPLNVFFKNLHLTSFCKINGSIFYFAVSHLRPFSIQDKWYIHFPSQIHKIFLVRKARVRHIDPYKIHTSFFYMTKCFFCVGRRTKGNNDFSSHTIASLAFSFVSFIRIKFFYHNI